MTRQKSENYQPLPSAPVISLPSTRRMLKREEMLTGGTVGGGGEVDEELALLIALCAKYAAAAVAEKNAGKYRYRSVDAGYSLMR